MSLYTIKQFCERNPAFTEAGIRHLVFMATPRFSAVDGVLPSNGLLEIGAVLRAGRKVVVHEERFLAWLEKRSTPAG